MKKSVANALRPRLAALRALKQLPIVSPQAVFHRAEYGHREKGETLDEASVPTTPMFARATKVSNAVAEGKDHNSSTTLKKTLFPSSSPQNGSINDFIRKPLSGTSQATTFTKQRPIIVPKPRSAVTSKALHSRSGNVPSGATATKCASTSNIAMLYGSSNSFAEEPSMPPSSRASGLKEASEEDLQQMGFSVDDFDDDDFSFDLEIPSALSTSNLAAGPTVQSGSFTSKSSWQSSPPSQTAPPIHMPAAGSNTSSDDSAKRSSPESTAIRPPQPVKKKRVLPKTWSKSAAEELQDHPATPGTRQPHEAIWDATASAVKVQKKQLKDLSRQQSFADSAGNVVKADERDPHELIAQAASLPRPSGPISLSKEQQYVKNLVCFKKASVFFTGPAGTGKSVLMRAIIDDLRTKYAKDSEQLGVTASTGLAACNIGGMTLHSFAGIGLGKEDADTLIRKVRQNPRAKNRWVTTKTLVIDEISMVDGDLFDKLSRIGRSIRRNGRPWGGIQLVLTGDFFQLPPVPDREKRDVKFAFEASTWADSIDHTIGLTEVFRQRDPEFAQMLNEMRLGQISERTVQTFKSLSRPLQFNDGLEVTELFPTRQEVESSNDRRLRSLGGKSMRYEALDTGEPALREKLLQNMMAPKMLELRVGAQVMLIKNMDDSLVNGSLGTVEKFMTETEYTSIDTASLFNDPDVKKRTLALNSYLRGETPGSGGKAGNSGRLYPYVLFHGIGGSTRGILIRPEEWKSELPNGIVQASRTQLPLILAWALSIHKAQGQTLERVKVDLGRVFEKGQAYVALSRATTKQGLQVLRFEKQKVMAHPKVVDFYGQLCSAESALRGKGNSSILAFTNSALAFKTARATHGTG